MDLFLCFDRKIRKGRAECNEAKTVQRTVFRTRLNDDGYRVEVTPNIPGILNGIKEELDKLKRGSRIRAEIIEIDKLGIKCRVAKGRRL